MWRYTHIFMSRETGEPTIVSGSLICNRCGLTKLQLDDRSWICTNCDQLPKIQAFIETQEATKQQRLEALKEVREAKAITEKLDKDDETRTPALDTPVKSLPLSIPTSLLVAFDKAMSKAGDRQFRAELSRDQMVLLLSQLEELPAPKTLGEAKHIIKLMDQLEENLK
jgi:hypothetical protein